MARIACIDDDRDILFQYKQFITRAGHTVLPLLRADRVLEELAHEQVDLVITDIMMPGLSGGAVYQALRTRFGPALPIIISSASSMRVRTGDDTNVRYVPKPIDYDLLFATINELLASRPEEPGADIDPV